VAGLLLTAATQHVTADLAFFDLAEEDLLSGDAAALAELAQPATERVDQGEASAAS